MPERNHSRRMELATSAASAGGGEANVAGGRPRIAPARHGGHRAHKRYQAGQLLGIREEKRRIGHPALQFDGPRVVRDLPRVLAALAENEIDEWSQLRFLAGANARR